MTVKELRNDLIKGKIEIDDLNEYRDNVITSEFNDVITSSSDNKSERLYELIMLLMDYYNYSSSGDSLIQDQYYDMLTHEYENLGNKPLYYSDIICSESMWEFVKHDNPGMVGSVSKIYEMEELKKYHHEWRRGDEKNRSYILAPKYDGISSAIHIKYGKIIKAVTRNDGIKGQNIIKVISLAKNINAIKAIGKDCDCWIKTELCVSSSDFSSLVKLKEYKNRRSATSGLVNSPKNLQYAGFITIIPLAIQIEGEDKIHYSPEGSFKLTPLNYIEIKDAIDELMEKTHSYNFEFRTDGVIIYPLGNDVPLNSADIMDSAIAFKVNDAVALSKVVRGYISIGPLGGATPMLEVEPVEVNETTITTASLSSFDKYASMDIHEDEMVEIFAAGSTIPQARIPENRQYPAKADFLKIKKKCPYCGEKLTRIKNEYKCTNSNCERLIIGNIGNFLSKLDVSDVSEGTIGALYENKLINDISSLFNLKRKDIAVLNGFGERKADIIVSKIEELQKKEIPVSTFMGALGIPNISEKKCRNIFKHITLKDVIKKSPKKLAFDVLNADNIGDTTAQAFVKFIDDNRNLIDVLTDKMNIVNDKKWKGNVVFTGIHNLILTQKFEEIGYETSSNINSNTVVCINASYNNTSGKAKTAISKGISVVHVSEIDEVIKELKKK